MKYLFLLFAVCLFSSVHAAPAKIEWMTNYEQAVNQAKSSNKPLILFFTGSDWCGWCIKLEEEVLGTPDFAREVGDKFVFVKLDFPLNAASVPSQQSAQNKQLQKKFDVRSFPTIVVFDPQNDQQIGTTGYRPGGGKSYAAHLLKMTNDYSKYKTQLGDLDSKKLSGASLRQLYEKAREMGKDNDLIRIVKAGMESDDKRFFLTERYRLLAEEGQVYEHEAIMLRQKLLASDPSNENHIHYQVAIIDFEACCEEVEKRHGAADAAVAPLLAYIKKFGSQDAANLWRLQMIISQVYFDKNDLSEALKYARYSYESAPASAQPEIANAIKSIQTQLAAH